MNTARWSRLAACLGHKDTYQTVRTSILSGDAYWGVWPTATMLAESRQISFPGGLPAFFS